MGSTVSISCMGKSNTHGAKNTINAKHQSCSKAGSCRDLSSNENDFHVHNLIDTGGFAFVFKAMRKSTGAIFALKVQPMEFMARSTKSGGTRQVNEEYLLRERTILIECRGHPFIVCLESAFCTSLYAVLVLEYVAGGTLSRLIGKHSTDGLPLSLAKIYTAEIALALDFMHSKGIIYRDVKPSNILICSDGHIKITDFGLAGSLFAKKKRDNPQESLVEKSNTALHLNSTSDQSVTSAEPETSEEETIERNQHDVRRVRRRTVCGTAGFRPPEQVGERYVEYYNRTGYDERADWFSLGVTVFMMVCGRKPFPTKKEILKSGVSSPSRKKSTGSSTLEKAAIKKSMRDVEFKSLMNEVSYPEHLSLHSDLKSFLDQLLARDPNRRLRIDGIKSHPWISDLEFSAKSLMMIEIPEWVQKHALEESKIISNSMSYHKMKKELSLNGIIRDICGQSMGTACSKEEVDSATARWMTCPSPKTIELFKNWEYKSDSEPKALDANYQLSSVTSHIKGRRETQ